VIFFTAGFFFLLGICSGGAFAFGPREQSRADRRLSIVDLPILCYDEIGREYFHRLLRAVGGIIVYSISISAIIGVGGSINVWQPYVGIGSKIMVELLIAQFLIGIECAIL
jgi:hypothetical protein